MRLLVLVLCVLSIPAAARPASAAEPARPRVDETFFNGKDLTGWSGPAMGYWSVEDGAIVGRSDKPVPRNEFLWSPVEVKDFYLSVDVKLDPNDGNGGIQFRSQKKPPNEALGYQADMGKGVWGRLYHESGRQKLDWRDRGEAAVKPGEWNRYEILAVGHRVWTVINGKLAVSVNDPRGELSGYIAIQIHAGAPLAARYRINQLVQDPKVELAGLNERQLDAELIVPDDAAAPAGAATRPATQPTTRQADRSSTQPVTDPPAKRFGVAPDRPVEPLGPFSQGRFKLRDGDVVVFAGQTNLVRAQQSGDLEAHLAVQFANNRPRFRSMAWEGDTVYQQWRDLNFGGWREQLAWAGATVVIAQFGQTEALDGLDRLDAFAAAYAKLVDEWSATTRRIVLVSPIPFEKPAAGPLVPDHTIRNADVRAYAEAVRKLAAARDLVYVDLFTPLSRRTDEPLTSNGLHLTPTGHRIVARAIAESLAGTTLPDEPPATLRKAVIEKNRLWFDNWRPMNWAFAYGDRTQVPFGQPGGGRPALRIEFEDFKPLIAEADGKIHDLAARAKK